MVIFCFQAQRCGSGVVYQAIEGVNGTDLEDQGYSRGRYWSLAAQDSAVTSFAEPPRSRQTDSTAKPYPARAPLESGDQQSEMGARERRCAGSVSRLFKYRSPWGCKAASSVMYDSVLLSLCVIGTSYHAGQYLLSTRDCSTDFLNAQTTPSTGTRTRRASLVNGTLSD